MRILIDTEGAYHGKAVILSYEKAQLHSLMIFIASETEDGVYTPAVSVGIYGQPSLLSLRDALNKAYPVNSQIDALIF